MKKNIEDTFVMIKPDGVEKNIVPEVIRRLYEEDLIITEMKSMVLSRKQTDEHYSHLKEEKFYPDMKSFMTSGRVVVMIVNGENAISKVRTLMGNTEDAQRGTIRGDYASKITSYKNVIHGSDSIENANVEIARFFGNEELQIKKTKSIFTKVKKSK